MLEDRDYMRQPAYRDRPLVPQMSFTVALLIVNAAVFVAELVAAHLPQSLRIEDQYLALSLAGLKHGFVWQLLTFQFMHAGLWHLLFNSMAIYFFGRPVETALGHRHFLTLYLSSGIIGGLVQMLFAVLMPGHFDAPVVGASAGASGLVAAFAILHWEDRFTLLLYFIPVTMTGKILLAASLALAFLGILTPKSSIANAAHLGGILTGGYYVRLFIQGRWLQWKFPARRVAPREFVNVRAAKAGLWRSSAGKLDEEESTDDFVKSEVDPILDKISAHGIQSLTERERKILEKARVRMTKH
jgi:membrane associated rhomboid family serine protease